MTRRDVRTAPAPAPGPDPVPDPGPTPGAPPDARIDPRLADAYRAAEYVVDAPDGPIVLRVGVASAPLAALMRSLHVGTAALLTAHNPWSRPTGAGDNAAAQAALEAELSARGVARLPAEGRDPRGAWAPEASVLALGLAPAIADALARRFGQNAWLRIDAPEAIPALAFTRPVGDDRDPRPRTEETPRCPSST